MILQEIEWTRISLILITQLIIGIIFLSLAYKILKRNKNRLTIMLSSFYISEAIGFIINIIYLPLTINPTVYILHVMTDFFISFGQIFLVIFLINLNKRNSNFSLEKDFIIIFSYVFILLLLFNFPGGITINENTNWRPVFSWTFLISLYIFFTCFIIIPNIILSIKIYKKFEDKNLKKKLKLFFLGINGTFFTYYGLLLYNTWDDPLFRAIWSVLSFIIIPSGLLIYYGIGKDL